MEDSEAISHIGYAQELERPLGSHESPMHRRRTEKVP